MRNKLKKVLITLMVFTLLIGAISVPSQNVQAASKLTKADFNFTGKYKSDMNAIIKPLNNGNYSIANTIDENNPKQCIKTKRGIILTSTKAQVFKKYGKVTTKKARKNSALFKSMKKNFKEYYNLIKNEKCAVYSYTSGSNTYRLHFFFDKNNKVNTIIVSNNC